MSQEALNIILSCISIVLTGLLGWGVTALTAFLNTRIKDKRIAGYLTSLTNIVTTSVKETYQTYVEALKKEGKFDADAQKKALDETLAKIKTELPVNIANYVTETFGDLDKYITSLIESTIYSLKNTTVEVVSD